MGDKGRQDPPEGELTIQQRETRKGVQWEIKGDKTLAKADTPSIEGKQKKEVQWETKGDKTLGKADTQEGAQWETKGDKTLGKADTPSTKGKQEEVQ